MKVFEELRHIKTLTDKMARDEDTLFGSNIRLSSMNQSNPDQLYEMGLERLLRNNVSELIRR